MPVWILIILALSFFLIWGTHFQAEIFVTINEDENDRSLVMAFNSRLFSTKNHYNYTDTRFSLLESLLITLYESRFEKVRELHNEVDYSAIVRFFIRNLPMKSIINLSLQSLSMFKRILRFTTIQKLEWKTRVGIGQADHTAVCTGFCWAIQGVSVGMLNNYCRLKQVDLDVKPDFAGHIVKSHFECIFKIRTAHIIYIQLYAIAMKVRWYLNGFTARTRQSPHRRINENCHAEY